MRTREAGTYHPQMHYFITKTGPLFFICAGHCFGPRPIHTSLEYEPCNRATKHLWAIFSRRCLADFNPIATSLCKPSAVLLCVPANGQGSGTHTGIIANVSVAANQQRLTMVIVSQQYLQKLDFLEFSCRGCENKKSGGGEQEMIVGYLAMGMLAGCIAGGSVLYHGYSLLMALGFFSMFGSIAVLCSAAGTVYAFPFVKFKILGQT